MISQKSKYDARKEKFIRTYAKVNKISESESRQFFREKYEKASDKQRRKIMRDTKNKIKDQYENKHPSAEKENRGFKLPKQKNKTTNTAYRKYKGKTIPRSYNAKTIKRVASAEKKFPKASNYELRHGVNSKASQEYRIRHGGTKKYSNK